MILFGRAPKKFSPKLIKAIHTVSNRQTNAQLSFIQIKYIHIHIQINPLNKFLGFKESFKMTHLPESSNQ